MTEDSVIEVDVGMRLVMLAFLKLSQREVL